MTSAFAADASASAEGDPGRVPNAVAASSVGTGAAAGEPDNASLIEQLDRDRLWLLRQIDSGRWTEWRLDLAALERELGQLLDLARDRGLS